jgi:ferric-dicitrate binding protein FerR (iron transport regulator)
MNEPITPWAEHQRSEWTRLEASWAAQATDELRPPETDEEPMRPLDRAAADLPRRRDARVIVLAFAAMAVIGVVAWAVQR